MNPLVRKEIRLLLPAWVIALLLAVLSPWFSDDPTAVVSACAVGFMGTLILSLTVFGREFALGTFSSLMSQPVDREKVITIKIILLLLAIAAAIAVLWVSYILRVDYIVLNHWQWWALPAGPKRMFQQELIENARWGFLGSTLLGAAVILSGGIWTTLVFRQMVAAFWVTILVPGCLWMGTTLLGLLFEIQNTTPVLVSALILYSVAGLIGSWRLFQRTEDTPSIWSSKFLPSFGELAGVRSDSRTRRVGHPMTTLLRQEISLHQVSLIGAGVLLLLNLASIGVRASGMLSRESSIHDMLEMTGFFWLLVPLMLGASAVSEERQLGTLEARLCLPVTHRRQFILKLGVAVILGTVLGAGALILTELLGNWLGLGGALDPKVAGWKEDVVPVFVISIGLTVIGFFASSLSRSSLQALGAAIGIGLAGILSLQMAVTGDWREFVSIAWIPGALWTTLFLVMMGLAYRNFIHIHCGLRRVMRNITVIVVSLTVVTTLCAGIYWRAWELLGPLEPEHGPSVIAGPGKSRIVATDRGLRLMILLPDGRVWMSGVPQQRSLDGYPIPTPGGFLNPSNWTDLAASSFQAIALRADGTLWSLCRFATASSITDPNRLIEDQPRQIGVDTNWVDVAAGWKHLLALKDDGTLWGWGENGEGQLTGDRKAVYEEPVRIGGDSDWVKVFAGSRSASTIGVRTDNTWWHWGRVHQMVGSGDFVTTNYTKPVPWQVEIDPAGLKELVVRWASSLLLREDGTLWAVGQVFGGEFGNPQGFYTQEPAQVGQSHLWADVDYASGHVGVTLDGSFWKDERSTGAREMTRFSEYSDWIAVSGAFAGNITALAADGTVCCWPEWRNPGRLTAPRGPLTSFNIFDESE